MTKYEWETELKKNIHRLPDDEIKRVLDYYGELFEDNIERGKSESAIINEFGNPADVAYRIMSEYDGELKDYDAFDTPPKPSGSRIRVFDEEPPMQNASAGEVKNNGGGTASIGAACDAIGKRMGLIVFIIITAVTGGAPMIIMGVPIIVMGSLIVAGVAMVIAGTAAVIVAVGLMISGAAAGLAQLGVSLAVIGLGMIFALLCVKLIKLYFKALAKFFKMLVGKE